MYNFKIPYETVEKTGVTIDVEIPENNLLKDFSINEPTAVEDLKKEVNNAINNPVAGQKFTDLIGNGKKVVFVTENEFRAAPSDEILPPLVEKAQQAGSDVSVVIANGKAPAPGDEEGLASCIGKKVINKDIAVKSNNVEKPEDYEFIGVTTHGTPLWVLREITEADSVITISTTQATLWGYGGSGMVLPGIAGNNTIETNHVMSLAPNCLPGNNECEMQRDKYESLKMADIDMGINVIVSNNRDVIFVNAGEPVISHKKAVEYYNKIYEFDISNLNEKADIVITGTTAPTDHLFFHSGWAIVNCEPVVKEGGTIIHATPCSGYKDFPGFALMDLMADYMPPSEEGLEKALNDFHDGSKELWAGCIWYPIYRTMLKADVEIITMEKNLEDAKEVGLNASNSFEDVFTNVMKKYGPDVKVAVVPYGRYTVLKSD